jgi:hypothetical protein
LGTEDKNLRLGSTILTIGYVALLAASIAIVSKEADPSSAVGRHLWAGALANAALALVEILVVLIALRKGEKWAWWAAALPLICYGLPILILDSIFVSPERLVETLAPQVLGLITAGTGLVLAARDVFFRRMK